MGLGFCLLWVLGLMGFACRFVLCLLLSHLDGYRSWDHGPATQARIVISRESFFFFLAMGLIFGWMLIVVAVEVSFGCGGGGQF